MAGSGSSRRGVLLFLLVGVAAAGVASAIPDGEIPQTAISSADYVFLDLCIYNMHIATLVRINELALLHLSIQLLAPCIFF